MPPQEGSDKIARYGARGALGGPQTVPRAEFKAIHHCLYTLKNHKCIQRLTIISDCKMAVDGMQKCRQYTSKTKRSIWDEYGLSGFVRC